MQTIKEQVENMCIHFNGIQNTCCKIGIKYHDIRGEEKPYRFPCLNKSKTCSKMELPTEEQVNKKVEELQQLANSTIEKLKLNQ